VTILAATYAGVDVTSKARAQYNHHGAMLAHNSVYGDPVKGLHKHLHVVYQHYSAQTGLTETFSQSFPESNSFQPFSLERENCQFTDDAIVNHQTIKVLGALYEGTQASCAARRLAATGKFSAKNSPWNSGVSDAMVSREHFTTASSGIGSFTLVYLKNNKLEVFRGTEGSHVRW